jgi:hypothetical protein
MRNIKRANWNGLHCWPSGQTPGLNPGRVATLLAILFGVLLALPPQLSLTPLHTQLLAEVHNPSRPYSDQLLAESGQQKNASVTDPVWENVTRDLSSLPIKRYGEGLAYDPLLNETVLFGGYNDELGLLNDTWVLRGNSWTKIFTAHAPNPRYEDIPMVFDPAEKGIILIGGAVVFEGGYVNDTWLFNGTDWRNLSLSVGPTQTNWGNLAWDGSLSGLIYLTDPVDGNPRQTWLFAGGLWKELFPVAEPPPLWGSSMTYDWRDQEVLLFGGENRSTGSFPADTTWIFSTGNWVDVLQSTEPSGRIDAKLEFDNATDSVVLFGGLGSKFEGVQTFNDTWTFIGGSWTRLGIEVAPPSPWLTAIAYDNATRQIVLVDGQSVSGRPSGITFSIQWIFFLSTVDLKASVSTIRGGLPLALWLNSSVSGGVSPYNSVWTLTNTSLPTGPNESAVLATPGGYDANLTVKDSLGETLSVAFVVLAILVTYQVTFRESGLPPGTGWSVRTTETTGSSASSILVLDESNGTYTFYVRSANPTFEALPTSFRVAGGPTEVNLTFVPVTYSVTFLAKTTSDRTDWSVTLAGVTQLGTGNVTFFNITNGTYSFEISPPPGMLASPAFGEIAVNGSPTTLGIIFHPVPPTLLGLPTSEGWVLVGSIVAVILAACLAALILHRLKKHSSNELSPKP